MDTLEAIENEQKDLQNRIAILAQQFFNKVGAWPLITVEYVNYYSSLESGKAYFPRVRVDVLLNGPEQ